MKRILVAVLAVAVVGCGTPARMPASAPTPLPTCPLDITLTTPNCQLVPLSDSDRLQLINEQLRTICYYLADMDAKAPGTNPYHPNQVLTCK